MPFDFSGASYVPNGGAGPAWAFVGGIAILGLGVGAAIVLMLVRARQLFRAQAREHAWIHDREEQPLFAGPSRVVSGRVELDGTETVGVEVDIVQTVRNHTSKNSRWHTWTEESRTVRAVPFYLVRDEGQCVYVEPSEGALIVDSLATSYPLDKPGRRIRAADVRVGEEFFAYGDLFEGQHPRAREGYRGGVGWVLRAPQRGRMLLATEGIRDRYKERVSFLWKWGAALAIMFSVTHAFLTLPFMVASLFGTRTITHIVGTNTYVTHHKNTTTTHYALSTRTDDGYARKDDVPREVYDAARGALARNEAASVPLLRTAGWEGATFLGTEPYVSSPGLIFTFMFGLLAVILLRLSYQTQYAWYDRKRLVDHGGSGHWVEPRPQRPVPPGAN